METLPFKRIHPLAKAPQWNEEDDDAAGLDFFTIDEIELQPGQEHQFRTGVKVQIERGYVGLLWDRSGLGKQGIHRLGGVIDSSYRGEIGVLLVNLSGITKKFNVGDKVIQMIIQKKERPIPIETNELSETKRGEKGFGSSG